MRRKLHNTAAFVSANSGLGPIHIVFNNNNITFARVCSKLTLSYNNNVRETFFVLNTQWKMYIIAFGKSKVNGIFIDNKQR